MKQRKVYTRSGAISHETLTHSYTHLHAPTPHSTYTVNRFIKSHFLKSPIINRHQHPHPLLAYVHPCWN
ncbi:hypothetical protein M431DRAFT_361522 [Trichoderma harzianum CBS 226.95]|uniref:Uncharacterized protein n=1 Tax=Trichoderma harzianum CBS 226.95 TaxID=983964 RepID=A0A2T4AMG9_TRIHA|nr:hypothetical protein M431DRAFT_361522 [Trichoderma harzianum CBS 226.95]PTB58253.1 hypothetical protein M431DRAFT_361522 [Trichoderma harzianum CBS 226.95]